MVTRGHRGLQGVTRAKRGFRTIFSTVTVLIKATDSWSLNTDLDFVNAVVFLDLKKAFYKVKRAIFLSKL